MSEVAVITYYNNFTRNERSKDNFVSFQENIASQGVPLFVYESIASGNVPEIMELCQEHYHSYSSIAPFWNRENALNVLVNYHVPKKYTKIIWIDPSVIIEDENWIDKVSALLETKPLVEIGGKPEQGLLALGATRNFFEEIGIFDFDFSGVGGDLITTLSSGHKMQDEFSHILEMYKENSIEVYFRILSYNNESLKFAGGEERGVLTGLKATLLQEKIKFNPEALSLLSLIDFNTEIISDKSKFGTDATKKEKAHYIFTTNLLRDDGYPNQIHKYFSNIISSEAQEKHLEVIKTGQEETNKREVPREVSHEVKPPTVGDVMKQYKLQRLDTNKAKMEYERSLKREEILFELLQRTLTNHS